MRLPERGVLGDEVGQHLFHVFVRRKGPDQVDARPAHVRPPLQHPQPLFHDLLAHVHLFCHDAGREIGQRRLDVPFRRGLDEHEALVDAGDAQRFFDAVQPDGTAEAVELQLHLPGRDEREGDRRVVLQLDVRLHQGAGRRLGDGGAEHGEPIERQQHLHGTGDVRDEDVHIARRLHVAAGHAAEDGRVQPCGVQRFQHFLRPRPQPP